MKPTSKIVEISTLTPEYKLIVLCEDGSVWWLTLDGVFTKIVAMTGKIYA